MNKTDRRINRTRYKLKKNSNKLLLNNLKMSKKFTLFNHYLNLKKIFNDVQFNSKSRF